ncbi:ABC transporter ATP-binding protein [Paenibacillus turpanensis]|uniref:ABC transporter ATP-binding protein n=1 Tax=Paenibacillus turpanensis TaxID=2689078 RepID=UPI00140DFDB3|nr:ABC transporter ATP-binding protein [Paenibacillus turpanensis]
MSMQEEKVLHSVKDRDLLKRLLRYAAPHWKTITLCIVFAFLIVIADLARPFLIKVAIDDHINGIYKPLVEVAETGQSADLRLGERSFQTAEEGEPSTTEVQAAQRKQIVQVNGTHYLVDGWLPQSAGSLTIRSDGRLTHDEGGVVYEAQPIPSEQIAELRKGSFQSMLELGFWFLLTVAGSSLLSYRQSNLLQYTGQDIIYRIRKQVFDHVSKLSMSFFDRNPVGRLVVRVTHDTESLNQLYSQVVVNLIKDIIVLLGIVFVMFQLSVKLTLLSFTVLPVLVLLTFWYKAVIREAQRIARVLLSKLNAFLAENLSGIRITQLFIREEKQWEQFRDLNESYYKAGMRGTVINSIFQPAIGFVGNAAVALLLWYGGIKVIDGAITFGIVYAFTHYIRQFFNPLMSLAEKYNQIQMAMVGAERVFELLEEKPAISDPEKPISPAGRVLGEIVFDSVWFAYEGENWVLRDVSFRIAPGQTAAFVGATGAGKSSIIQLINRFYDIQKGKITLDGVDIRDIPIDELRSVVGMIQQDVFLFTGDIASNIRLRRGDISDEEVEAAARMVHMHDFVEKLPQGYRTELGERGVTLSLGQRQLLSFARAIVFRPSILILDEATSNIDTETEQIVQEALAEISRNRTTLIVAHRLSTIQHADQIIVLHKGAVQEYGTHHQLLAQKGYYHRLFELQYKEERAVSKEA